jgi:hypothetical protein
MLLLNQALGFGCDPNVSFATYQVKNKCRQTTWEHWLHEQYLYSQRRHSRAARRGDGAHQSIDAAQDIACQRIQENVSIIDSFLRHGADPLCTPCTTDHHLEGTCSPTALNDVLQSIVPPECLSPLQTLLVACSNGDPRSTLRRNQRKRAIRSRIIPEQRFFSRVIDRCPQELRNDREDWAGSHWEEWRDQQRMFFESLMNIQEIHVECETWEESSRYGGLLTWCLDCGSRSLACLNCLRPHDLTNDAPCTEVSNFRTTQPQEHTTVAFLFDVSPTRGYRPPSWDFDCENPARLNAAYQSLGCGPGELDLTLEAIFSVLKEWYAKNPIEPDSLQGDYIQDISPPEGVNAAISASSDPPGGVDQ